MAFLPWVALAPVWEVDSFQGVFAKRDEKLHEELLYLRTYGDV